MLKIMVLTAVEMMQVARIVICCISGMKQDINGGDENIGSVFTMIVILLLIIIDGDTVWLIVA